VRIIHGYALYTGKYSILEVRSSIGFCWPCRVFIIFVIVKAREGANGCSEEVVSWDDTTWGRGTEMFSSSLAQWMVSSHALRKEMLGWVCTNFLNSFLSRESWTFSTKCSLGAWSSLLLLDCYFWILAYSMSLHHQVQSILLCYHFYSTILTHLQNVPNQEKQIIFGCQWLSVHGNLLGCLFGHLKKASWYH